MASGNDVTQPTAPSGARPSLLVKLPYKSQSKKEKDTSATTSKRRVREKKKIPSLSTAQSMVKIVIKAGNLSFFGVEDKVFCIHKDFLCYYSPFFEAAFNSSFSEGDTQTMTLDDISEKDFGAFVYWVYNQALDRKEHFSLVSLQTMWFTGRRFLVPQFQNTVMKQICRKVSMGWNQVVCEFAKEAFNEYGGSEEMKAVCVAYLCDASLGSLANSTIEVPRYLLLAIIKEQRTRSDLLLGYLPKTRLASAKNDLKNESRFYVSED